MFSYKLHLSLLELLDDEIHQVDPVHHVHHKVERCDDICRFPVDICRFPVDIGRLPVDIGRLPVDIGRVASLLVVLETIRPASLQNCCPGGG